MQAADNEPNIEHRLHRAPGSGAFLAQPFFRPGRRASGTRGRGRIPQTALPAVSWGSLLTLVCALLLVPATARAGGFSISILGGRRTGALTNLAAPDDLTALFHNPAGLADQPGTRIHLSGSMTFMDTEFRMQALDPDRFPEINPGGACRNVQASADCPWPVDAEGYYTREIQPEDYFGVLPYVGVSQDLGLVSPRARRVVLSLAVTAPNLYGANLPLDAPTAYSFIEGFFATVSTTLGAGWRINRYLAVGANLSYNYMKLTYAQRYSIVDLVGELDPGLMTLARQIGDLRLDYSGVDHGVGWNVGLLITPHPRLTFGLSYNGATPARFEGDLEFSTLAEGVADLKQLLAALNVLLADPIKLPIGLVVEMPIPHSIQAGVNVVLARWLEVGFDFRLWLYTLYDEQVLEPRYDEAQQGEPPLTREDLSKDKGYGLSYEVALGFVLRPFTRLPTLELMTGVGYDKSPVPGRSFSLDNPSMDQLVATLGLRWRAVRWLRVAASYMVDYYMPRDIRTSETSPPTNVQAQAVGHLPRIELEFFF